MCTRGVRPAAVLLLLAALAGDAGTTHERRRRQAEVVVAGAVGAAGAASLGAGEEGEAGWRALWEGALEALRREPSINNTREDVLAQLGGTAFLHCPVRDLGERGVSWVRRRDWHILSAGLFMYTSDERFQVLHADGRDDWTLQIKYVQQRDNGTYECQVSTSGGVLSRQVTLHVAVPEAFILGADEHHVDQGSALSLVCIIEKSPVPPQYVFWFHNERMINYDASAGVTVRTEPGAKTQSTLTVRRAAPEHGGNYSCRAPNTEPARILVYVTQGSDKMAATLSRSGAPRARVLAPPPTLLLTTAVTAVSALTALHLPHRGAAFA